MTNPPLCQFGPGGDYARPWPGDCEPVPADLLPADVAVEARKLGIEPELLSLGRDGIRWRKAPSRVAGAVRTIVRAIFGGTSSEAAAPAEIESAVVAEN